MFKAKYKKQVLNFVNFTTENTLFIALACFRDDFNSIRYVPHKLQLTQFTNRLYVWSSSINIYNVDPM